MNEGPKKEPRHLTRALPPKTFKVDSGDVVGGFIYFFDKHLGIEEGMMAISIDSEPYREYLKNELIPPMDRWNRNKLEDSDKELVRDNPLFLELLTKYRELVNDNASFNTLNDEKKNLVIDIFLHHPNVKPYIDTLTQEQRKEINKFFKKGFDNQEEIHRVTKIPWKENRKKLYTQKMHEINTKKYVNNGMGGLLFKKYKEHCGIDPTKDSPGTQIKKLADGGNPDPNAPKNQAYMIKQDGKLVLGGTGPGFKKILKTTVGRALQENLTPKKLKKTLGFSALYFVGYLGLRRLGYLLTNRPKKANADALRETISTKIASARGVLSQKIEIVNGTYYENGPLKFVPMVPWSTGCHDFSGKLEGSPNEGVIVAQTNQGETIKKFGNEYIIKRAIKIDGKISTDAKGNINYNYIKIDENGKHAVISQEEGSYKFNAGLSMSESRVDGLGESLIHFICLGDRDGIGKKGQNKGYLQRENGRMDFFGLDYGKAFNGENPIVGTLRDDFTFDDPPSSRFVDEKFYNYSVMYDNPLREKMKGIYMLAALRGQLKDPRKSEIINEYAKSNKETDHEFVRKLAACPENGSIDAGPDFDIIDKKIKDFQNKRKTDRRNRGEYDFHIKRLDEMRKIAVATDAQVLNVFSERSQLLPSQIDAIERMEKLCARKVHILSPDGTVILNHIQVKNADRIPWQFVNGKLTCDLTEISVRDREHIKNQMKMMKKNIKDSNPELAKLLSVEDILTKKKIEIPLAPDMLKQFNEHITEENIAKMRGLDKFRNKAEIDQLEKTLYSFNEEDKLQTSKKIPQQEVQTQPIPQHRQSWAGKPTPIDVGENEQLPRHRQSWYGSRAKPILNMKHKHTSARQILQEPIATQDKSSIKELKSHLQDKAIHFKETNSGSQLDIKLNGNNMVYAKATNASRIEYSTDDLNDEQFRTTMEQACVIAIDNAKPNATITISPELSDNKKQILVEEFTKAIERSNRFTEETKPKIVTDSPLIQKPSPR